MAPWTAETYFKEGMKVGGKIINGKEAIWPLPFPNLNVLKTTLWLAPHVDDLGLVLVRKNASRIRAMTRVGRDKTTSKMWLNEYKFLFQLLER